MDGEQPDESWGDPQEVTPDPSWGEAQPAPQQYSRDQTTEWGIPEEVTSSAIGAGVRRGLVEAPVGAVAARVGMAGAAAGEAAGGPLGGLAGGLGAGIAASTAGHSAEDWLLDHLGLRSGTGWLSDAQEAADRMEHPEASHIGELAGNFVPGFGIGGVKGVMPRLTGAAVQTGIEGGQQIVNGQPDLTHLGEAAVGGALFARPRGWMQGGSRMPAGARPADDATTPPPPPSGGGGPGGGYPPNQAPENYVPRPDAKAPLEGEVLPPERSPDIEFATQQRDSFQKNDPMWDFWNEHVADLEAKANGKVMPGSDEDAHLGPASAEHPFSYQDSDRMNDVTTVARGVAAENPRVPDMPEVGNPVGAPMQGRIAQRPNELGRDYRKALPPPDQGALTTGEVHPDIAAAMTDEQLDTAIAKSEPPTPPAPPEPLSSLGDPVQASQLQREAQGRALENLRQRDQSLQKGEDFQGLPGGDVTAPVTPPAEARPRAPGIDASVGPQEQRVIDEARKQLDAAGMKRVIAEMDKLPPRKQAEVASSALAALKSKNLEGYGTKVALGTKGEVRIPQTRATTKSGMTARSPADAARKQGVLDAYDKAVAQFTAKPNETDGQMMDRLGQMVRKADELTGGATYRPNVKPPSWQIIRAARAALAKPTKANRDAVRAAEAMLAGRPQEDFDASKDAQDTARIESDIAKRPQLPPETEAALVERSRRENKGRPEFEPFDNSDGGESQNYAREQGDLRNWLNGLEDEHYSQLAALHPDLETNVRGTQDPRKLMYSLLDDLAEAQRKDPPRIKEHVVKDEPVKAEPAKAPVRTLDKNSPEFKRLAEANAGKLTPEQLAAFKAKKAGQKVTIPQSDKLKAMEAAEAEGAQNPVIDGGDKSALEQWAAFMSNKSGAVDLKKILKDLSTWMAPSAHYWSPRVDPAYTDYGDQIGLGGKMLNTQLTRINQWVLANARSAVLPDGSRPMPAEFGKMYRALENKDLASLSQAHQDYWNKFGKPIMDRVGRAYDDLRDISQRLKLPGADEMPERRDNGPGFADWVPRRPRRADDAQEYDPITNRSLSNWATSGQERDWFALQNPTTGDRRIYRITDEGKMVFYQNGTAGSAKTPPSSFNPAQVGETLTAGNNQWKVDHAKIDELMQHGRDKQGALSFMDNPIIAASDAYVGLRAALARVRLLESILDDPKFQQLNTKSEKEAIARFGEGEYAQTDLPQLKGRYMPKAMAWAFDDLVKTGFHHNSQALQHLSNFAQGTLKPFYFLGPEVHVFNEADKLINASPILGKQLPSMPAHFKDAVKSVHTQDATQAEIMQAGGNPMYAHAMTARLMPQLGKLFGEDLSIKPWKYDPLMKAFGTNTRDVLDHWYHQSSKVMWYQSDVLYTGLYKAFKAKGMSPEDAVHETEKIIDSYVVPTTVGNTFGLGAKYGGKRAEYGRFLQKFLTDPLTSNFGRFHYGLAKTLSSFVQNALGPNSTPAQRAAGAAQLLMVTVVMPAAYKGLSALYAKLTGNPDSEFEQRGVTKMVGLAGKVAGGDFNGALNAAWTPSTPVSMLRDVSTNRDSVGRQIIDPRSSWSKVPGQALEYGAGVIASPLRNFSAGTEQGGADFGFQKFLEGNLGLKTPSPAASKYKANQERNDARAGQSREKRPRGVIEDMFNRITK